jgi:hypothetical protein
MYVYQVFIVVLVVVDVYSSTGVPDTPNTLVLNSGIMYTVYAMFKYRHKYARYKAGCIPSLGTSTWYSWYQYDLYLYVYQVLVVSINALCS